MYMRVTLEKLLGAFRKVSPGLEFAKAFLPTITFFPHEQVLSVYETRDCIASMLVDMKPQFMRRIPMLRYLSKRCELRSVEIEDSIFEPIEKRLQMLGFFVDGTLGPVIQALALKDDELFGIFSERLQKERISTYVAGMQLRAFNETAGEDALPLMS